MLGYFSLENLIFMNSASLKKLDLREVEGMALCP